MGKISFFLNGVRLSSPEKGKMLIQKFQIGAGILSAGLLALFAGFSSKKDDQAQPVATVTKAAEIKYGIDFSDYVVREEKVKKNEVFVDLFKDNNVSREDANTLVAVSKEVFNPSKIIAGHPYTVLGKQTKAGFVPQKMIYEENNVDFVVFNLADSFYAYRSQKEVEHRHREVAGIIRGSLYGTFDNLDLNPAMAVQLSEIFACDVDFYKIQEGDKFKIIFEEDVVDGKSLGATKISAAIFNSGGKDYSAFYYLKDGAIHGEYYDAEGNSMRKQFLKSPVKFARISSRFNLRRFHPVTKHWKSHLGTDYAAPHGTPILATADGVVEEARHGIYNGNYVKLRHNGKYKTQYLHMSKIAKGMCPGVRVKQGQTIGYVGSTGLATGPHVCYRFWKDGKQVDPFKQSLRFSEPLPKQYKGDFLAKTVYVKKTINELEYTADPHIYLEEKRQAQIQKDAQEFVEKYF